MGLFAAAPDEANNIHTHYWTSVLPKLRFLEHDEALAELTQRYFSHGPATLQDFVWWSGLTTSDARQGIDSIKSRLACETINDQTYWFANSATERKRSVAVHLLPNYDEYTVGYTARAVIFDVAHTGKLELAGQHSLSICNRDGRTGLGNVEAHDKEK